MIERDGVEVQQHHSKLVWTEEDKVGQDELRVLEHLRGDLDLGGPAAETISPGDGDPLRHPLRHQELGPPPRLRDGLARPVASRLRGLPHLDDAGLLLLAEVETLTAGHPERDLVEWNVGIPGDLDCLTILQVDELDPVVAVVAPEHPGRQGGEDGGARGLGSVVLLAPGRGEDPPVEEDVPVVEDRDELHDGGLRVGGGVHLPECLQQVPPFCRTGDVLGQTGHDHTQLRLLLLVLLQSDHRSLSEGQEVVVLHSHLCVVRGEGESEELLSPDILINVRGRQDIFKADAASLSLVVNPQQATVELEVVSLPGSEQTAVLEQEVLVEMFGRNVDCDVKIEVLPTPRDPDGLQITDISQS